MDKLVECRQTAHPIAALLETIRDCQKPTSETRLKIALWRWSILGPLVTANLQHGDSARYCAQAAERVFLHPNGHPVRLSARAQ